MSGQDRGGDLVSELAALPRPRLASRDLRALTAGLAAGAADADRTATLSRAGLASVHAAGLLAPPLDGAEPARGMIPAELSVTTTDLARAFMAMGAGDPSVALVALMTAIQHRVAYRRRDWPVELHREILRESAARPVLINAARAEPGLGSAARGGRPETTLRRTAAGWVLNGRKRFVTGAEHLDYHVVWALDPDRNETERIIVPGSARGVEVVVADGVMGMRASSTFDVVYRDVEVPADHLCLPVAQSVVAPAQEFEVGIAALYIGIARAALDELVGFLARRAPSGLGTPLSEVDRIQLEVGRISARLVEAESVLFAHTRANDSGEEPLDGRLAATKHLCTNAAIDVVEGAVRLGGGYALAEHGNLARHLRDVLCARPHPPQDDVSLRTLGRAALDAAATEAAPRPAEAAPVPAEAAPAPTAPGG